MTPVQRPAVAALAATVALSTMLLANAGHAQATQPLPGERFLTPDQEARALRDMPARERAELEPLFADDRNLIVAYARRLLRLDVDERGRTTPVVEGVLQEEPSALDIPSVEVAEFADARPRHNIYLSLTVYRTCSGCLTWNIRGYFDWSGGPLGNGHHDRIGLAWDDGLSLRARSYWTSGKYTPSGDAILVTSQTVNPSAGVGWHFHESLPGGDYADWGRGYATMQTDRYRDQWTDVVFGYAHTGPLNFGGSIGIGPGSISFYGSDAWEWQFSVNVKT